MAVFSQLWERQLQLSPRLNYHQAPSLTRQSIQRPRRACLIGDLVITGDKFRLLPVPANSGASASVYPVLVRFIVPILGEIHE